MGSASDLEIARGAAVELVEDIANEVTLPPDGSGGFSCLRPGPSRGGVA